MWDGNNADSPLHVKALRFLYEHNDKEFQAVCAWCTIHDPSEDGRTMSGSPGPES